MSTTHRTTLLAAAVVSLLAAGPCRAAEQPPADVMARLKAGNATFVANASEALPVTADQRQALTQGQHPFAIVLSCADSRVPPEVIFHTGLGDLFVVRVAGGALDKSVLGSLEYAAEHLHVPALIVMGHESCGAVKAAVDTKAGAPSMGPNLDYLIKSIKPAFARMRTVADAEHLRDAILANVEQVVNDLLAQSDVIAHLHATGKLLIAGAYYELESGRVRFSAPVAPGPPTSHPTSSPAASTHGQR